MKAMLLTDYKQLELTDMPVPEPQPDELLVRVHSCGVCGSDIHGFDGSSGRRVPPLIMGHEASGVVENTGSNVSRFQVGDRVTFDSMLPCGACSYCEMGNTNLCTQRRILGVSCDEYRQHGAFAEYVVVPERVTYPIPDELKFEYAAMVEPVSVAVHAVGLAPLKPDDTALVVGSGMIGLLIIQALRAAGCQRVFAIDLNDKRLELARQLGAIHTFNAGDEGAVQQILDLTDSKGVDVALEAVGATAPIQTAIACLRRGGTLTLVGNISPEVTMPLQAIVTRELKLLGSCASSGEYPECIEMLADGRIQANPLISACASLEDGPGWFDRLYGGEPHLMKVILQP